MTDARLRELAETMAYGSYDSKDGPYIDILRKRNTAFHDAVTPKVVINLLDRLEAAERVVGAARRWRNCERDLSFRLCKTTKTIADEASSRAEFYAALDGENADAH